MSEPYTKHTTYTFKADDEIWEVTHVTDDCIWFEETRKNGQEDTHMSGEAVKADDVWRLDESGRRQIEMYSSKRTADAIEAFFNEHGPPGGN